MALLTTASTPANPHFATYDRSWQLDQGLGLNVGGSQILAALCWYLAATQPARLGLADPTRTAALVNALAARRIKGPFFPPEPLMGPRLDVWNSAQRVLDERVRGFFGRTVAGEAMPDLAELVANVQSRVPRHIPTEWKSAERVRPIVQRLLTDVEPWPFGCLTTAPDSGLA